MITRENCRGVWVSVDSEWNDDLSFNASGFAECAKRFCESGMHGVYTTGSAL